VIWRWMVRSMNWRELTRPTWKAPYTFVWYIDRTAILPYAVTYLMQRERELSGWTP